VEIRFGVTDPVLAIDRLEVRAHEVCAIVGPNGAGKTTLLGVLALLDPPTRGEVRFFGEAVRPGGGAPLAMRRRVSLVAQDPYLFETSVLRNVAYGLRRRGVRGREARSRAVQALEAVGLAPLAHRGVRGLSGGERKRIALARALALAPDVLLLDEPAAHVDARNAAILEGLVRRIVAEHRTTVVFATHDLGQAYRLEARVVALHDGRAVESAPENVFAARLEGEGVVKRAHVAAGVAFDVVTEATGEAHVVVDAREVILSRAPLESSARNVVRGRVVAAELSRGCVRVSLDAGVELIALVTEGSYRKLGLALGDEVTAAFKATAVRVY